MTSRYDQDTILGYVEGELNEDQRAAFETMLEADDELRQLVARLRLDRQMLRGLADERAPEALIDQVMQVHERALLLGDPGAADPLPLSVPMSRRKLRRVLMYSGIAAIVLLSFSVVFHTLIPPGLQHRGPQLAEHAQTPSAPYDDPGIGGPLDVGSGLAMVDEDAVYDELELDSDRKSQDSTQTGQEAAATKTLTRTMSDAGESADTSGAIPPLALTLSQDPPAKPAEAEAGVAMAETQDDGQARSAGALASSAIVGERVSDTRQIDPPVVLGRRARGWLAESEPAQPVAGGAYLNVNNNLPLAEQNLQLQVHTASPKQARRDIRDWAIANSARVVEQPTLGFTPGRGAGRAPESSTAGVEPDTAGLALGLVADGFSQRSLSDADVSPSPQLVVMIEDKQVPGLLAYLNRGRGQRADLVVAEQLHKGDLAFEAGRGARKERRAEEAKKKSLVAGSAFASTVTPAADAADPVTIDADQQADTQAGQEADEHTDEQADEQEAIAVDAPSPAADKIMPPLALSNRMVTTGSAWRGDSEQGRSLGEKNEDAEEPQQARAEEPEPARADASKRSNEFGGFVDSFGWALMLDTQPPEQPKPQAKHDEPRQITIPVIIRQVPGQTPTATAATKPDPATHTGDSADQPPDNAEDAP